MAPPIESITKTIFYPCNSLVLKLKVMLGSKDYHGRRKRFIAERSYSSAWYSNTHTLNGITINTFDYLALETFLAYDKRDGENYAWKPNSILFSYHNINMLYGALQKAYFWLIEDPSSLYNIDADTSIVIGLKNKTIPASICESDVFKTPHSPLKFMPTLIPDEFDSYSKAIAVYMGERSEYIASLTTKQLSAFIYFLDHFDLCTAAMLLVNQTLIATPLLTLRRNTQENSMPQTSSS